MITEYLFWFLAFVAIFGGLATILARNPVHSVLYLILTFFAIAGHYLLLNAQFLAAVHVIVYAGAIMVLFLYVIMMLNLNSIDEEKRTLWSRLLSAVAAGLLMLVLVGVIRGGVEATAPSPDAINAGLIENLGMVLYRDFLLPFELTSILFLSAMVGAVFLSKKEINS
jgi:NADH-quinone oxidoreductase subunit J